MRRFLFAAVLGLGGWAGTPGAAPGQDFGPMTYNQARAYHHFLSSPYSYRTYSGTTPGFAGGGFTPYGYEAYRRGPGYFQQRITPRGYESYYLAPPVEGFGVAAPWAPVPPPGYHPYPGALRPVYP